MRRTGIPPLSFSLHLSLLLHSTIFLSVYLSSVIGPLSRLSSLIAEVEQTRQIHLHPQPQSSTSYLE
jgi:HAMP domain-containing protein